MKLDAQPEGLLDKPAGTKYPIVCGSNGDESQTHKVIPLRLRASRGSPITAPHWPQQQS